MQWKVVVREKYQPFYPAKQFRKWEFLKREKRLGVRERVGD